jgi:hypothetical protein
MVVGMMLAGALSAMADDTIHVTRIDSTLASTGRFTWAAGGEIQGPMQIAPAGEVIALVARAKGEMDLLRWSPEGKEVSGRRVELATAVLDSRLEPDGSLVVVDEKEIVKLGRDGKTLARRQVPELKSVALSMRRGDDSKPQSKVAAASEGAWIVTPERLLFARFEGKDVNVPAPIGVRCEAIHQPDERECKEAIRAVTVVANEAGECLLSEELVIDHRVKGYSHDRTEQLVLSVVSRTGDVLAQRTFGKVESRLEWFWVERGSHNPTPFPSHFGIVRRRYSGLARLGIAGERRGNGFIAILEGRVRLFDSRLRDIKWDGRFIDVGMIELSPAWTKGMLIVSGDYVNTYDEAGMLHYAELKPREGEPERTPLNTAIGQTPGGEWIVAWHSTPPEEVNPD